MIDRLSVVCPCYNEEQCVDGFVREVCRCMPEGQRFEIVLVDDGSSDGTLRLMKAAAAEHDFVRYVSFSRNFGKEAALLAGLRKAQGDVVVTMDADLQDPPAYLPEMIAGIEAGYDCVAARRVSRAGEPPVRSWFARGFYWLMRKFSDVELVDGARDYRMMRRKVVDSVLSLPEINRFTKGIYQWVGYRTRWIEYENVERTAGETKWSFWKLFKYAVDGIVAFTIAPLRIATYMGFFFSFAGFAYMLYYFIKAIVLQIWTDDYVRGYPSLLCFILFIGGLMLMCLGIIGEYIGRIYIEAKGRPIYIVSEESKD